MNAFGFLLIVGAIALCAYFGYTLVRDICEKKKQSRKADEPPDEKSIKGG